LNIRIARFPRLGLETHTKVIGLSAIGKSSANCGMPGRVTISRLVTHWATGDPIPEWCYTVMFDVIESNGGRIVVGNLLGCRITPGTTAALFPAQIVDDLVCEQIMLPPSE
jgi:hypothetical protein